MLCQPPYSPDTNILDRFVFPKMEMKRARLELNNRQEVYDFVEAELQRNTTQIMRKQFDKLKNHYQKVIDNMGNYVFN